MLIPRLGADCVAESLPPIVQLLQKEGRQVCWSCDPMHGNTEQVNLPTGKTQKTRRMQRIFSELETTIAIHRDLGSVLGGVHLELTGTCVSECLGGEAGVEAPDLMEGYRSACDPRLNPAQSLETATLLARRLKVSSWKRTPESHRSGDSIAAALPTVRPPLPPKNHPL